MGLKMSASEIEHRKKKKKMMMMIMPRSSFLHFCVSGKESRGEVDAYAHKRMWPQHNLVIPYGWITNLKV